MIASGILLALTMTVTVAWLYVELTDTFEVTDRSRDTRDDDGPLEV